MNSVFFIFEMFAHIYCYTCSRKMSHPPSFSLVHSFLLSVFLNQYRYLAEMEERFAAAVTMCSRIFAWIAVFFQFNLSNMQKSSLSSSSSQMSSFNPTTDFYPATTAQERSISLDDLDATCICAINFIYTCVETLYARSIEHACIVTPDWLPSSQ